MECVKSVGKVNYTLGVKLSHPYIGVCENNRLCEMRRFIRRPLGTHVRCLMHWACLGGVACIRVRVFVQVTCVDPAGSLSTCQRWIGFLAGPKQYTNHLGEYEFVLE